MSIHLVDVQILAEIERHCQKSLCPMTMFMGTLMLSHSLLQMSQIKSIRLELFWTQLRDGLT